MYQTLYRKWRPKTFSDVYGQAQVTSILAYQVEHKKTSHAYLFCGSRGTGKTTCAKILAKALNCETPVNGNPCGVCASCKGIESGQIIDVLEMDAASNRRIDDIREIRDEVAYAPTELGKRVIIIDEVHMLTTEAFNALLKTLEEPPEHIVFILATTELQKIPPTILSRCQRYDFHRIDAQVIVERLRYIADREHILISDEALYLIAKVARGGMRDAIGMLELCSSDQRDNTSLQEHDVAELIGTTDTETMCRLLKSLIERDYDAIFLLMQEIYRSSKDIGVFWQSLAETLRDLLIIKTVPSPAHFFDIPQKALDDLTALSAGFTKEQLLYDSRLLDDTLYKIQRNPATARIHAETALLRMCDPALDTSQEALLARIAALEESRIIGGTSPSTLSDKTVAISQKCDAEKPTDGEMPKTNQPDPVSPPVQHDAQKKLFRLRSWQDAAEYISKNDAMFGSFMSGLSVYESPEEQTLYLFTENAFTYQMLNDEKKLQKIIDGINVSLGEKRYDLQHFRFSLKKEMQTSGYELIDELIAEIEDNKS